MEFTQKFTEAVLNFLSSDTSLEVNDSINAKKFEARAMFMSQLESIIAPLDEIRTILSEHLQRNKTAHASDVALMNQLMGRKNKSAESDDWTRASRKRTLRAPKRTIDHEISPSSDSKYTRVKLTEALLLRAIKVQTFDLVVQDGDLYYVESADHFAIKIGGHLLHGNIGIIYTDGRNPEKIKNCKFATGCQKQHKCDYYHDPAKFPGSRDHRNFIANSWMYVPPTGHFKGRQGRRFGSRDNLDTDIVGLTDDEIGRYDDQLMHDLLCALLIVQSREVS